MNGSNTQNIRNLIKLLRELIVPIRLQFFGNWTEKDVLSPVHMCIQHNDKCTHHDEIGAQACVWYPSTVYLISGFFFANGKSQFKKNVCGSYNVIRNSFSIFLFYSWKTIQYQKRIVWIYLAIAVVCFCWSLFLINCYDYYIFFSIVLKISASETYRCQINAFSWTHCFKK